MKLVKLTAYLQFNAGDDLMVEQLLKRYPDYTFYGCIPAQKASMAMKKMNYFDEEDVYSIKFLGWINHFMNVLTLHKKNGLFYRWIFSWLEKKCCCAVSIGGSVYRPIKGESLVQRIERERKKHAHNNKLYVIGANFGPYDTDDFLKSFYKYFKTCSGVSFRDSYSYNLFKELPNVQWAPDVVLTLDDRETSEDDRVIISVLGFKYHPHLQKFKEDYVNFISSFCTYVAGINKIPVLVGFCESEGDTETMECILDNLDNSVRNVVKKYTYHGDTEELVSMFANCGFIIATRFHSMILGIRYSKKMFTISYESKSKNVLQDVGNTAWCDIESIFSVSAKDAFTLGKEPLSYEKYINSARLQFAQLDCELRKNR